MRSFLVAAGLCVASFAMAQTTPLTLRVDYFHSGGTTPETFALDAVVQEPLPWAGPKERAVDPLLYGAYGYDVRDAATKRVLFSNGFGSIFDEWSTTEEAKTRTMTFHESVRFPTPSAPVTITVRKRQPGNTWLDVWSTTVDPKSQLIDTAKPWPEPGALITFEKNGEPTEKVDLLILGDGYTAAERAKFEADGKRMMEALFATAPFKEHRKDFNVWGLVPVARESGISHPSREVHRANPLGTTFDSFGSERYILTFDNKAFRKTASFAPYDVVEIVVNERGYGGGGIYNLFSTVTSDNAFSNYVFVHEFGHQLAALADEYYTSQVAYLPPKDRPEPWEPNVTANATKPKWFDLVSKGTPLPTPWKKAEYEARSKKKGERIAELFAKEKNPDASIEKLYLEEAQVDRSAFSSEKFAGKVGVFEGANYVPTGFYRSQANCIMFTREPKFCAVCQRAITQTLETWTH